MVYIIGKIVECEGYEFKIIKSNREQKPYKVRCVNNGIEEDSESSYEDAMNLIISQINYSKEVRKNDNENREYIEKEFKILLHKKMSEINDIVETEIAWKIDNIRPIKREEFALEQVYLTPDFKIIVSRENYRSAINKVSVEERIY